MSVRATVASSTADGMSIRGPAATFHTTSTNNGVDTNIGGAGIGCTSVRTGTASAAHIGVGCVELQQQRIVFLATQHAIAQRFQLCLALAQLLLAHGAPQARS